MKYTEKEAKALLKVMGFKVRQVDEWSHRPDAYFRYTADCASERFSGDTYVELLDYYFLLEKRHEQQRRQAGDPVDWVREAAGAL
jgi:hypothetical protein